MGGAEVALLNILASLRDAQPDWKLNLIVSDDGPLAAQARGLGVCTKVLSFPRSLACIGDASLGGPGGRPIGSLKLLGRLLFAGPATAIYIAGMRKEIRRLDAQVVHTNGFKMHVLGALAKPPGVPLVWHIHDYLSRRPFMARLLKRLHKRCSMVLANSDSVKTDFAAVCGNRPAVQTVYNRIDTAVFSPHGPFVDLDQLSGLPLPGNSLVRVGMLATFARWKGHEVFLRALSLIPSEIPLRGYVIGAPLYQTDGSQYTAEELKAMAHRLGISNRVGFTGFVDQPASAIRSLDIVVHASTQPEPFGLVIVEGMACARPVIVSAAGGAVELIETGENALGHRPGDAAQLAERITRLAIDPELRARLGTAGRATVEQRFDRRRLAAELAPIYQNLVKAI